MTTMPQLTGAFDVTDGKTTISLSSAPGVYASALREIASTLAVTLEQDIGELASLLPDETSRQNDAKFGAMPSAQTAGIQTGTSLDLTTAASITLAIDAKGNVGWFTAGLTPDTRQFCTKLHAALTIALFQS